MTFIYLLTYLLTPWCRVLFEKLTGLLLVKKCPAFHGTRRFITALKSVRHLSLSWASPMHSIYPHPTSWRSILILSAHLRLGLPSGVLPSGFRSKTLNTPSPRPYARHAQPISYDVTFTFTNCCTDKESNHTPGKEQVLLLLYVWVNVPIFCVQRHLFESYKNWKLSFCNLSMYKTRMKFFPHVSL